MMVAEEKEKRKETSLLIVIDRRLTTRKLRLLAVSIQDYVRWIGLD